ncbi:MAG TPA: DUF1127 domain-containing protein [Reyranellaceae bacterium]|nr:DUF1127 domain-containing protein [Reyranellaceae bacterium]
MMTQPIRSFEALTSEPAATKVAAPKIVLGFDERARLEARARYARAEMVSEAAVDAVLWIGRQIKAVVAKIKANGQARVAEDYLRRMSDRELADLGITRSDIQYAVRTPAGVAPKIAAPANSAAPANQNLRHAA